MSKLKQHRSQSIAATAGKRFDVKFAEQSAVVKAINVKVGA